MTMPNNAGPILTCDECDKELVIGPYLHHYDNFDFGSIDHNDLCVETYMYIICPVDSDIDKQLWGRFLDPNKWFGQNNHLPSYIGEVVFMKKWDDNRSMYVLRTIADPCATA